ncbi:MAG TPA: sigma-70 family RNA polymerase sigma factor [Gemmatimonadales bacterium]
MQASHQPAPDPLSPALDAVVTKFAGLVRGVGWRHRLSEAEIHEVMQQVRIRLWQAQGTSEQISRVPASYVYRTAVSAVLDMMRRRRTQRTEQMLSIEDPGVMVAATANPERDLESSELVAQVTRAIESIPLSRRAVVRMYLAGHPREEIADLLGWSEAKTRNLLYRGLGDLRARLTEQGIGWETGG